VASLCGIGFNMLQPRPLLAPAAWGVFFVCCHLYHIQVLLREKRSIVLDEREQEAYEKAFMLHGFTPQQFLDIFEKCVPRCGSIWHRYDEGQYIAVPGDRHMNVHHLLEGEVVIISQSGDRFKTVVPGKGAWLGELYDPKGGVYDGTAEDGHVEEHVCTTVDCLAHNVSWRCVAPQCRTMAISKSKFHRLVKGNPRLESAANRALVNDLWGKIHSSSKELRTITYQAILEMALVDGILLESERRILVRFREKHSIPQADHNSYVSALGWSLEEYDTGFKEVPQCGNKRLRSGLLHALSLLDGCDVPRPPDKSPSRLSDFKSINVTHDHTPQPRDSLPPR